METVGIRKLRLHLNRYLRNAKEGRLFSELEYSETMASFKSKSPPAKQVASFWQ